MLITCLSGLSFHARPWNCGDHTSMIEAAESSAGTLPMLMLQLAELGPDPDRPNAPHGVEDPGPYQMQKGQAVDWDQVSYSDITMANIALRARTRDVIELSVTCENCGSVNDLEVNATTLSIYPMTELGIRHLREDIPISHSIETPNGVIQVQLRDQRGRDIPTLLKWQKRTPKAMLEIQVCMGIVKITTPDDVQLTRLPEIREFYRTAPWEFREGVEDKIDELFGGVDTSIKFTCKEMHCRTEQETVLPLDAKFYGLDHQRKQRRLRRSSSGSRLREPLTLGQFMSSASESPTMATSTSED